MTSIGKIKKEKYRLLSTTLIGTLLFVFVKPSFVEALVDDGLDLLINPGEVEVGTEVGDNGYRQVKYKHRGKEVGIDQGNFTNTDPDLDGNYIVWLGQTGITWQVFLHNVSTGETTQLTTSGNNINASISGKYVVWEGEVGGVWQIFMFDGIRTTQLTNSTTVCGDVAIDGGLIVYSEKTEDGKGRKVFLYNIEAGETLDLTPDSYGSTPTISNGNISWVEIVDGESVTFSYNKNSERYSKQGRVIGVESVAVEDSVQEQEQKDVVLEEPDIPLDSEEPVIEEPVITEEVPESTESTSTETVEELVEDVPEQPDQVTEEDIKEELGIPNEEDEEEQVEDEGIDEEIDPVEATDETILEIPEAVEGTSSSD